MTEITSTPPSDVDVAEPAELPAKRMRRVAVASLVGTVIEFYDFGIYGTAAALVFAPVFFPALGAAEGTVAAFATLGVAFIARPFGAILFGHFGDRHGRKKTLIATMLTMGIATILVGLMPTAAMIGAAAPILLVVLRFAQGLAAGGEWAGAALFVAENAPAKRRGFWGMFPSFGGGFAIALSSTTFLLTAVLMSPDDFVAFGWRIPFLASFVLVFVGMWVRLSTEETTVFRKQVEAKGTVRVPFLEVFRRQPRELLLASGVGLMAFTFNYIAASYLTNYGTVTLELDRPFVLGMGAVGGLSLATGILVSALASDRIGRRRMLIIANAVAVVWALALFPLLDTNVPIAFGVGVVVTFFIGGLAFGPMGALFSELFQTRYRYTAAGLAYNIAGIVGGAVPPLIAAAIIAAYGSFAFSLVLVGICLVALVCTLVIRETRGNDLTTAGHRAGSTAP